MQSLAFFWFQLQMTQQFEYANRQVQLGQGEVLQYSSTTRRGIQHEHEAPYQNRSLHRDSCLCPMPSRKRRTRVCVLLSYPNAPASDSSPTFFVRPARISP